MQGAQNQEQTGSRFVELTDYQSLLIHKLSTDFYFSIKLEMECMYNEKIYGHREWFDQKGDLIKLEMWEQNWVRFYQITCLKTMQL